MPILGDIDDYGVRIPQEWNEPENQKTNAFLLLLFLCGLSKINEYERLYTNDQEKKRVLLSVKDFIRRTTEEISENFNNSAGLVVDVIITGAPVGYDFRDINEINRQIHWAISAVEFYLGKPRIRRFLFDWWNKGFCVFFFPSGDLLRKNYFQFEYISLFIESYPHNRLNQTHPSRRSGDSSYISLEEFESFDPILKKTIMSFFYGVISGAFLFYKSKIEEGNMESLSKRTVSQIFQIWGTEADTMAIANETLLSEVQQIFRQMGIMVNNPGKQRLLYRALFESLYVLIDQFHQEANPLNSRIGTPNLSPEFINDIQRSLKHHAEFFPLESWNNLTRDISFYRDFIMNSVTLDETSESVWDSETLTLDNDDTSSSSRKRPRGSFGSKKRQFRF